MCLTKKGAEKRSDDMNDDTVPDVGMTVGSNGGMPPLHDTAMRARRTTYAKTLASAFAAVATFTASAIVVTGGENYPWTYAEQSDGTIVLGGNGNRAAASDITAYVEIPSSIKGKAVTAIGKYAFRDCRSIKSVTIPASVKKIEEGAFFSCTSLSRLVLPEELTDIEDLAFSECWGLTNSQGFVIVKDMLFNYYGNDVELTIPSNVKRLSSNALYRKYNLINVTVPSGVTNIGKNAFAECESLKSVTIPSSVVRMGEQTFYQCGNLESVTLPDCMTEIDNALFAVCASLKSVRFPADLKNIGSSAFSGCASLEEVAFPSGVTNIGEYAFAGCSSISSVLIPSAVEGVGKNAFERCSALAAVRFLGDAPAMGCDLFTNPPVNAQVTIPVELEGWAGIGDTWYGMAVVAAKPDGGPYIETVDGVAWTFSVSNGMATVGSKSFGSPSIPRSVAGDIAMPSLLGNCEVVTIGEWAFRYCDKLTSVSIPEGVTSIGLSAFEGCSSLRTVAFPSSMIALGDFSFYNCSSLKRVLFKDDVLILGDYAFCGCISLESVTFNGNEPAVGKYAFYSCPETAKVFVPPSALGWAAPGNAWNGMTLHHAEPSVEITYANSLPEFTAFSPEAAVKIWPIARTPFTAADAADMASKIPYVPADVDQDVRFFKGKGTVNAFGAITVTAELDLEAMEFSKTSKELCEKMAVANGASVTITLPSAKPGFWYGVVVADNLAALETLNTANAAARATGNGVTLTVPKPAGGTAFFKVLVNTQEIPVR